MAYDTIYLNPGGEVYNYQMDFAVDLPSDAALSDIGSGSTITATDSGSVDVSATILASKTRTAMVLSVKITPATNGEDYNVLFLGKGATTTNIVIKVLEVRSRTTITGAE